MSFSLEHWEARIGRRLRLHDLHVFLTVVQWGSMAKAAHRLAVSQPAISKSIADLEQALKVRLLDRRPHGVEPTLYGRALARRGLAVFDELRQGVGEIEFLANPLEGEVRIGCHESLSSRATACRHRAPARRASGRDCPCRSDEPADRL
jgi:DNA-binding transcriptional LysR family regulator